MRRIKLATDEGKSTVTITVMENGVQIGLLKMSRTAWSILLAKGEVTLDD
jgi:hypothetical protein